MNNEELFEMLVKQGTLLVKTQGEYSDYHIVGLYRTRKDVILRGKGTQHPRGWILDSIDPEDFEPVVYTEAHTTIDWEEGTGRIAVTNCETHKSQPLPEDMEL